MNTKLSNQQTLCIAEWLKNNQNITIKEVRMEIEKQFKIIVSSSTVHRIMQKLGFVHKKPRPQHHKQDPLLVEEYKKNIKKKSKI